MSPPTGSSIFRITPTKTMELLNLYQQEECLWNTTAPIYKNVIKRQEAAVKIARALKIPNFNSIHVRKKFKNLRDSYSQELKKIEAAQKQGWDYKPSVYWFEKMDSFIRPHLQKLSHSEHLGSLYDNNVDSYTNYKLVNGLLKLKDDEIQKTYRKKRKKILSKPGRIYNIAPAPSKEVAAELDPLRVEIEFKDVGTADNLVTTNNVTAPTESRPNDSQNTVPDPISTSTGKDADNIIEPAEKRPKTSQNFVLAPISTAIVKDTNKSVAPVENRPETSQNFALTPISTAIMTDTNKVTPGEKRPENSQNFLLTAIPNPVVQLFQLNSNPQPQNAFQIVTRQPALSQPAMSQPALIQPALIQPALSQLTTNQSTPSQPPMQERHQAQDPPANNLESIATSLKDLSAKLDMFMSQKEDNYDSFGKYIAGLLRRLPQEKAIEIQPRLISLITEAELEESCLHCPETLIIKTED